MNNSLRYLSPFCLCVSVSLRAIFASEMTDPNAITPPGAHCRICGSLKLNRYHFALELSDKIGLYQILTKDNSLDQLIRPCNCRGDFAYAHSVCISDWIETTKHQHCDICRYRYEVRLFERSFLDWIAETKQVERMLRLVSISVLIYYVSFLGLLAHWSTKEKGGILGIIVSSSAYIWITGCSANLIVTLHQSIKHYWAWKVASRRVVVEPNKNLQLEVDPRPKDVLKSSGFKQK